MKPPKLNQSNSNTESQRIIEIKTKNERFNENDWNNKKYQIKAARMIGKPNERKR
jgi:hypothetical protein